MSELIVKGAIKKDERGKFVMTDGSMIIREREEPLSSAVYKRLNTTSLNLITLPTNHSYSDSNSDFSDSPIQSYLVMRTPKIIKANTKYKFESVFPPPVYSKHHTAKSSITKSHAPLPSPPPLPPLLHPSHPIPTEVSKSQFDPLQDNAIMENATTPKVRKFSRTAKDDDSLKPKPTSKKASAPMKSAISQQVQPIAIIDKILNTPINIIVGEVFDSSREISSHLQNYMKFKRATTGEKENVVAFSLSHTRKSLIQLAMECSERPLKAIIDTGSMCNVVSYKVYQACINLPIDKEQELIMKDANRNSTWVIFNDQLTLMKVLASPGEMPLEVQLITTEEPPLPQPVTEIITTNALYLFNMSSLPSLSTLSSYFIGVTATLSIDSHQDQPHLEYLPHSNFYFLSMRSFSNCLYEDYHISSGSISLSLPL
ncbi:hypothetical protein NLI96_g12407 [Meripilus lineatus]|uniref:DUF4100 domain-containing protein n=1 Tax=Meripilus lineatus TaxID=2056292 RepID=A0AAD5UQ57_9APHY|nr:hypothetical protein NLI96_g12407 [Physisporinus lineatus]